MPKISGNKLDLIIPVDDEDFWVCGVFRCCWVNMQFAKLPTHCLLLLKLKCLVSKKEDQVFVPSVGE